MRRPSAGLLGLQELPVFKHGGRALDRVCVGCGGIASDRLAAGQHHHRHVQARVGRPRICVRFRIWRVVRADDVRAAVHGGLPATERPLTLGVRPAAHDAPASQRLRPTGKSSRIVCLLDGGPIALHKKASRLGRRARPPGSLSDPEHRPATRVVDQRPRKRAARSVCALPRFDHAPRDPVRRCRKARLQLRLQLIEDGLKGLSQRELGLHPLEPFLGADARPHRRTHGFRLGAHSVRELLEQTRQSA
mmetsp:Transcript_25429/g.69918  ORF Transcript_25429/g.69918 Transcript_25429/m.69918 type:complete len:248 (+) Transcript_25429:221-964(+)